MHERNASGHVVQFYNDNAILADTVAEFVAPALLADDGAVVLATQMHRELCDDRLRAAGIDLDFAQTSGRYVSLDAADILERIMIEGQPDPDRFLAVVGSLLDRILTKRSRIHAFGELVSLLWMAGKGDAAVALERLWNAFIESRPIFLHCAYTINLATDAARDSFLHVCAEHRGIIHSPNYLGSSGAK